MKLIVLLVGLAAGFGIGVYWGVHHPTEAATLSAQEEAKFIELQLQASQAIKAKLDQIANKQSSAPAAGKSFVGSGFLGKSAASGPDPDVVAARDQQDAQIQQLQQKLAQLKK